MKAVSILGSTGSIGVNTLDVLALHPEKYCVVALSGWKQVDKLFEQCLAFQPQVAVVADSDTAKILSDRLKAVSCATEVAYGTEALVEIARLEEVDIVMAAIVGAAGLSPTLAAAKAGKRILLANKESLVISGRLLLDCVHHYGAQLLPVDSEHSAILQSLPYDYSGDFGASGVKKIILTASGGPFRNTAVETLYKVTPDDACAHPNWVMGRKISVDSASLMNKGLEVIEAHWLFNASVDCIDVVVHPQSVIHSMVQFHDGSVMAQMGTPDMRTPIACALDWPTRVSNNVAVIDWFNLPALTFEKPDIGRFPCLKLAFDALRTGGDAPAILNAANEIAVEAFLAGRIGFMDIPAIVTDTLESCSADKSSADLPELLECDRLARATAHRLVERK